MGAEKFEEDVRSLLFELGENGNRPEIVKTPKRFLKGLEFLCSGYQADIKKIVNGAIYVGNYSDLVLVKGIEFYSLCEHHLLPFYGVCHVGYLPNGRIVGLSKIPRIVNVFARRLQVQEGLTAQLAHAIDGLLKPKGVGIYIEASHLCMMMRGVEKQNSKTVSSVWLGAFKDDKALKNEFLSMLGS